MGLGRRNQAKQCPRPRAPAKRTSWSGRFARARLRVALDSFEGFLWPWSGREFCETPLVDVPSSRMETFKYKSCEAGKRGKAMNNICASLPNLCRLATDPARHLVVRQFFSSAIGWCIDNPFLQWIQVHKGRGIDTENVLLLALRFQFCFGERVLPLLPRRLLWHVCIVHIYGRAYSRGNTDAENESGGVYTEGVSHAELPGEWSQANKFDKANLTSLTNALSSERPKISSVLHWLFWYALIHWGPA